jgi:hypothetical protein
MLCRMRRECRQRVVVPTDWYTARGSDLEVKTTALVVSTTPIQVVSGNPLRVAWTIAGPGIGASIKLDVTAAGGASDFVEVQMKLEFDLVQVLPWRWGPLVQVPWYAFTPSATIPVRVTEWIRPESIGGGGGA